MSEVIYFYLGREVPSCRWTIDNFFNANDSWLENTHDYIQWIFPIKEKSSFNIYAPILSDEDILQFRSNQYLIDVALAATDYFFYFLKDNKDIWVCDDYNHNHLRISRLFKFLFAIGHSEYAENMLEEILEFGKDNNVNFSKPSLYWKEALKG